MPDHVFQVFVPNGTPTYTYVKRQSKGNEEKLAAALDMPKMVISVSGPSKTGKTALLATCIMSDRIIPVSGQSLRSASDLWQAVMRWIGGPDEIEKVKQRVIGGGGAVRISAQAGAVFAKGGTEGELNGSFASTNATTERYSVAFFESVSKELGGSDFVVFLDDFHYIPKEAQVDIAKSIKAIAERGVRVCIASVPHRSDDMVRANDELTGRIVSIMFDYWLCCANHLTTEVPLSPDRLIPR
ncbi:MAG: hypothetical protein IOC71_03020, partial [Rhodobacter sp.]|nr:hypothetical protein [Rhodobacter sp.]